MEVKRILHVVGRMDRAGAETMIMNLYREIDRTQTQFDFVYFANDRCDYDDEIEAMGGRIVRINSSSSIGRFFALLNILRKGDWRIVHAHTLFSSGLHLLAAKLAKVPMRVAHSHSTSDANSSSALGRGYQNIMRRLMSWAATDYIACGKAAAEYLFPGRKDVHIIPNAIDINRFVNAKSDDVIEELQLGKDKLIILQVGRFMPVKNHMHSVKIAAALRDAGVDFQMLFVGTGPEQDAIKTAICKENLQEHVRLLGLRTDIPELMAAADVMLMPSLHEGFPVVLVESQAAGLPAVIANTISPEVDLDIGLVEFFDLGETFMEWAIRLQAAAKKNNISIASRLKRLEMNGFSACAGAFRLVNIYE